MGKRRAGGQKPVDADSTLKALSEALDRISAGDFSVRLPVPEQGTPARVALSFNRLAESLQGKAARATRYAREPGARQSDLLALQRRLGRAERLVALGAMAAKLAHELGTPLHSVAGHLDLLLAQEELPLPVRERAEIVAGEVERLGLLIRRHLRWLRSPEPEPVPTNVNSLMERIMAVMRPVLEVRSIASSLDLDPEAAAPFPCDARHVEQVVMNLVQNALDAMPEGGSLVVRTAVTESGRAISVCDDGDGIPEEHIDRVFEPFFTTKEAGRGTGLGLSLCREIARNHGGDIVLDSKPGIGTVVTLTLAGPAGGEETP
jgi:signal transduction histidine kinase